MRWQVKVTLGHMWGWRPGASGATLRCPPGPAGVRSPGWSWRPIARSKTGPSLRDLTPHTQGARRHPEVRRRRRTDACRPPRRALARTTRALDMRIPRGANTRVPELTALHQPEGRHRSTPRSSVESSPIWQVPGIPHPIAAAPGLSFTASAYRILSPASSPIHEEAREGPGARLVTVRGGLLL